MLSIIVPDQIETATQGVYWTILALFFVLTILGWLTIGKSWFQDDTTAQGSGDATENIPLDNAE